MKVVIIGRFSHNTKARIRREFPPDWDIVLTTPETALTEVHDAEALIPEHLAVSSRLLDMSPKLLMVQTGAGYDNVDIPECTRRNIRVCGAAGVNASAVAEHTLALILSWYKNIGYLDGAMKSGLPEEKLSYRGAELAGKCAGIIGLGAVGAKVARLCCALDMSVLGCRRGDESIPGVIPASLDEICAESDVISVHVPLTEATKGMIGARELRKMKSTALLVNTARGGVVDEERLIEALREHEIAGACLDVYEDEPLCMDSPLRGLSNVLLTPHTAGYPDGEGFHKKRYEFFAENIKRALSGERPEKALNEVL